jgi:hypothetical protein
MKPEEGISRGDVLKHPGHVFVPRGDPALTRALLARGALRVVAKRRGRVEQIGVAALPHAVDEANHELEGTEGQRALARDRSRAARARGEEQYHADFDRELGRLYPAIPDVDREGIVTHACEVASGRVGRTAAAKALAEEPIRLAVVAWIRHQHTDYDARLRRAGFGRPFGRASREDRQAARRAIRGQIDELAARWATSGGKRPLPSPTADDDDRGPVMETSGLVPLWRRPLR